MFLRYLLWIAPISFALILINVGRALANSKQEKQTQTSVTTLNNGSDDFSSMGQVNSVSQLSDVQPTDWAFQALQSLVERYGCISGYPNGTYKGNRAITRYEFAAGLNACLERINQLLASSTADVVKKEDLETIQKLSQQFADQLTQLRKRIDPLEQRTAILQSQQFSTTTKLSGDAIFTVAGLLGNEKALDSDAWRAINARPTDAGRNAQKTTQYNKIGGRNLTDNTIFGYRVRLLFDSSFSGKDRLRLILKSNNTIAFNGANKISGTNMTRLGWDTPAEDTSVQIGKLFYSFPVGRQLNVVVDATGGSFFDNFNTVNPLFSAATVGAITRFGRFAPIYRASNTGLAVGKGSGLSAIYKFNKAVSLSAGFLARNANDPSARNGLFDGSYGALAQLTFQPSKDATLALTYAHSYFSGTNNDVNVSGAEGSGFANNPFGTTTTPIATSANDYGLEASYRLNSKFILSGWVGYTQAIAEVSSGSSSLTNQVNKGDKADIWNWAVTLGFPDLGKKGNLAGIIFGQPPKVTGNDYGSRTITAGSPRHIDSGTSYQLEGLYRYQLNSHISVTPGFVIIFNPENNDNNDTIYEGVIRSTFIF